VSRYLATARRSVRRRYLDAALIGGASSLALYWLVAVPMALAPAAAYFWAGVGALGGAGVAALPQPTSPRPGGELRAWHVLLTFHFCVLCRVFFRADDLQQAGALLSQIAALDGLGIRPGLLGLPALHHLLGGDGAVPTADSAPFGALWLARWGLLG